MRLQLAISMKIIPVKRDLFPNTGRVINAKHLIEILSKDKHLVNRFQFIFCVTLSKFSSSNTYIKGVSNGADLKRIGDLFLICQH